jgi:hypothetical protein
MLLSVAIVASVLAVAAIARAGEAASGSTETLKVEAPNERLLDEPMTLTVEGTADGLHRLFVYGEADVQGGCRAWPYKEQAQSGVVTLTGGEGEALNAGHFSNSFVVVPSSELYGVCAYLDTTASANPDVLEYGCFQMAAHLVHFPEVLNLSNCYMSYETWWASATWEQQAAERQKEKEAQRGREDEELEGVERRQHEEAAAREAAVEAERRRAVEEGELEGLGQPVAMKVCRVPALRLHTLAGARRLLRDANCRLGRVRTHHGHGKLVVESQSPKRGKALPYGSAVSIVLGHIARVSPGTAKH